MDNVLERSRQLREAAVKYTECLALLKLRYPEGPRTAPPGDRDVEAFYAAGQELEHAAIAFAAPVH